MGGQLERVLNDANIYLLSTLQITYLAVTQFLCTYCKRKKIAIHFGERGVKFLVESTTNNFDF